MITIFEQFNNEEFKVKDKVITPMGGGYVGVITKLTDDGLAWVKIKDKWDEKNKTQTFRTFKIETYKLMKHKEKE